MLQLPCPPPPALQQHAAPAAGPGPSSTWHSAAAADTAHWRPRSKSFALWLCAATLVGGCGIFYGALVSHEWMHSYTWLTPAVVEERIRHPTPRRQQLMALMLQERQQQRQQQQRAETER